MDLNKIYEITVGEIMDLAKQGKFNEKLLDKISEQDKVLLNDTLKLITEEQKIIDETKDRLQELKTHNNAEQGLLISKEGIKDFKLPLGRVYKNSKGETIEEQPMPNMVIS